MPGEMIRRIIERKVRGSSGGLCISGLRVVYDTSREDWDRVTTLEVGGEPLDPEREYRVVCTSFLMEGNSGLDFLTTLPAERIELTQITTAEALEKYIRLHTPVRPRIDDRWVESPGAVQADYLR
jgi:5'-nucleotidase